MHITILALGSRGDIAPMAWLGQALKANGHLVRLVTMRNFERMATSAGIDYHPLRGDAQALLAGPDGLALTGSGRNTIAAFRAAMRSFGSLAESYAQDLSDPRLLATDAVINQLPACLYGYDLAERSGATLLTAAVIPMTRTRHFPMVGFPGRFSRIPGYNSLTYRFAEQLVWQAYRKTISRWRQATLALSPAPFMGHFAEMARMPVPVLNGFSKHVVPRPSDWGSHVHVTGYWFPPEESWLPPDSLLRFLQGGPPPIFVGFGSMPIPDPAHLTSMVVEALRRCDRRGVLLAGSVGLAGQQLPDAVRDRIHVLDYAPFDWLFPRVAGVIHHGGSGTTAAGLRAGVPSAVVPFVFDQFYWGRRLAQMGVAADPVPFKKLTEDHLVDMITRMVHEKALRCEAAEIGRRIKGENGLERAVTLVDHYLAH